MMLSKRFMMGILGMALVFGYVGIGCDTGNGDNGKPGTTVDTSALTAGIAAANTAKAGVVVGEKATVAAGLKYVSHDAMTVFDAAIATAEAVKNKDSASQAEVDAAVQTLSAAVAAFTAAVKTDGEKTSGFSASELTALIETASAAKAGVVISTDGTDQPSSVYWVTQAVEDAFNAAVTAAQSATDADRDATYSALVNAINTFNAAKQAGSKANTVTITGLSDYNGWVLYVYLTQSPKLTGDFVSVGVGTVRNGLVTVSLANARDGSPWAGTGSWYVAYMVVNWVNPAVNISKSAHTFTGGSVSVPFSSFQTPEIEPAGHLTGSVTLTNAPASRPQIKLYAAYYYKNVYVSVDLVGAGATVQDDGSFSLPFTQRFLDDVHDEAQSVDFWMVVGSGENKYYLYLNESSCTVTTADLSGGNLDVGSLGEASLGSITLSGTLKVNDGGQPVPRVTIWTSGSTEESFSSPQVTGQDWSLTIPALDGSTVAFSVDCYDTSGNMLYATTLYPEETAHVSGTSISGIVLDIGDISVGRMSGTITFTDMPSPPPYKIYIGASFQDSDNGYYAFDGDVTVDGSNGTWTIPPDAVFLAALDRGEQEVEFRVYVGFNRDGSLVPFASIEKTISKNTLANIDLGSVSLATLTLRGTLNVTFNGQPVPRVNIDVYDEHGRLGSGTFTASGADAPWTMHLPAPDSPTDLSFSVYGYTENYGELFSADDVATVSQASSGVISNIAIMYHYELSMPSSATQLALDTWTEGTLNSREEAWYQFTSDGSDYYVSWNDSYEGDGSKTADLEVSAYTSAGIPLFATDSGWTRPSVISGQSGTIYIKVDPRWRAGTYALKLSKSSAGNGSGRSALKRALK
ncbi:MAG: hypothetical protein LBG05_00925 [Treponema sp.]|jgi:hypothetical protein|nr:hypothetical protein [Treponema sp.]